MAKKIILSKESSKSEIKAYFNAVLKLSQSDDEFPVNLDEVWPLVYSALIPQHYYKIFFLST